MIVHYNIPDKESYKKMANDLIENNFDIIEPFFPVKSGFFHELVPLFLEINRCLIFECFFASITLTNHTLEKILKISLVYDETKLIQPSFNDLNAHYKDAHNKFQGEDLSKTINMCCSRGLITKEQKNYLNNEVREQLRNGFSHSDPNKIIDHKNEKKTYMGKNPNNPNKELTDLKLHPFLQSQIISDFAKAKALNYYKNVVSISLDIIEALHRKHKLE